jgi:5'-nucleotidase
MKGIRVTRQGLRVYRDALEKRQDPRGKDYYWIGGDTPTGIPEEGSDVGAIARGFTSITPLQLDLTAVNALSTLLEWGWQTKTAAYGKEPLLKFTEHLLSNHEIPSTI